MPADRGPLSAALLEALRAGPGAAAPSAETAVGADPYGDDLQLALYLCYELHYRGLPGVDDAWEWDPGLLRFRAALERAYLTALRADVPVPDLATALREVTLEPAEPHDVSEFLRAEGRHWQLREYAAHRSLYQLKEADPHLWVVPRLVGRAKAAMVAVEYDEFGAGHADRVHARLFADLMRDLGLDDAYGRYTGAGRREMLALVNLMSLLGLHRALRGALVGHFAAVEIASPPASRRLAEAMARLEAGPAAVGFYTEHVEADAVHEQLVRHEVVGGLLAEEPGLADDVAFGVAATGWLEERFGQALLRDWRAGSTSLYAPL